MTFTESCSYAEKSRIETGAMSPIELTGRGMDVSLVALSPYSLPSKNRAGAIVFDGTVDMQLWPGSESDIQLRGAWGDGLQRALDTELRQIEDGKLPMHGVCRVVPGRLHCDFLAWVATRDAEPGAERQPAPDKASIRQAVLNAIEFVAPRNVEKLAFCALGSGPGELPIAERLAIIVEAAQEYHDTCFAAGKSPGVEEVLVCDASTAEIRKAKRLVGRAAKTVEAPVKKAPAKKAATKRASTSRSRKKGLTADEVAEANVSGLAYNMREFFNSGTYIRHAKFGVGRVEDVSQQGRCVVLFEDGTTRTLVHGRS